MQTADLKLLIDTDAPIGRVLVCETEGDKYEVEVCFPDGGYRRLESARGKVRQFATLDAAVKCVHTCGYRGNYAFCI